MARCYSSLPVMEARTRIEAIGVYLPERVMTTEELLQRCRRRPRWDLERITGILERRIAAEDEHALDLAVAAAKRALAMSRFDAGDLDLVICTSISKYNRTPEVDFEPASATSIRRGIGADSAGCFDIVNACAGMFNGILVADAYLKTGQAKAVMVVSGEHNWPLMQSATREIRHSFDGQLAALTLGDAGAAIILERSPGHGGFRYIEMVTGAKHNHYCHSGPSRRGPGGILITKARGLQLKGAEHFPQYLKKAVDCTGWSMDEIDFGIAHQVSVRGVKNGVKALGSWLGSEVPHPYLFNCDVYANTTTTSHFVVLHEQLKNETVQPENKLLFVSGASGIVITHATYVMDDLGERLRAAGEA